MESIEVSGMSYDSRIARAKQPASRVEHLPEKRSTTLNGRLAALAHFPNTCFSRSVVRAAGSLRILRSSWPSM